MLKKYRIYRLWTYICSLCLIIILLNVFPNSKERIINQTIEDFTTNTSTDKHDQFYIFSKPHNDMYISAFRIFLDNKFFGVGPRQFRNTCDQYVVSEYSCETHPHHTYIELLSEAGIFAFIIVTVVFLLICYTSIKHLFFKLFKNKEGIINDLEVCLLASIIISLWPFSPSGSFFNNWMSIVYYFPVGILIWQRKKAKN